jgi:hypothetical protein
LLLFQLPARLPIPTPAKPAPPPQQPGKGFSIANDQLNCSVS